MKKAIIRALFASATILSLCLSACSKDDNTPDTPADDPVITNGVVLVQGIFSGNRNYQVMGTAKVIEQGGQKVLRFENFSSSNGPDLKVYLAADLRASSFISLGALKTLSGNQNYALSGMPDLDRYPFALVWCEQFGALFGSANLK
jgi:hypothetical protein